MTAQKLRCLRRSPESIKMNYILPTECIFDINEKPLDGIGVTPDIEVDFNQELYNSTGSDSQFDRALEFIRTGK